VRDGIEVLNRCDERMVDLEIDVERVLGAVRCMGLDMKRAFKLLNAEAKEVEGVRRSGG